MCVTMEDIYHKSLGNAEPAQLTAVFSTETVPLDSRENVFLNAGQCSEEQVLKCTFKACDPEQTGEISVFRVIEYLQEMTGQNCEDWRFRSLYKRLDPEERGIAVDFPTFHAAMKDWIADCQQEGEEIADLTNCIKDLQRGNKQLAVQNIKLQSTIEAAEELNSRLSEEISDLKGKLRGTQQALEQARVTVNELEDIKFFSKSLEEENNKLQTQARHLEKEQQLLSIQMDKLQDENKKLLMEKERSKCKIREMILKKTKMEFQLCEYEKLISCKDVALNENAKRVEELMVTLDEYRMVVQELKMEVNRLQDHLCQPSYQDLDMLPRNSLDNMKTCLQATAQPLCMELKELLKNFGEEASLPSPFCGMIPSLVTDQIAAEDIGTLREEQEFCQSGTESNKALLQRTLNLSHPSVVIDAIPILEKNQEGKQQQIFASEIVGSMEKGILASKQFGIKMLGLTSRTDKKIWTCSSFPETQVPCSTFLEKTAFSITDSESLIASQKQALVPVQGKLSTTIMKKPADSLWEILLYNYFEVLFACLLPHIFKILILLVILTACFPLLAIFCLVLSHNQHPAWTECKGNPFNLFELRYLHPPPF